jgi:Protein of unknown function (DUF2442)
MGSDKELKQANLRGRRMQASQPRALKAWFDPKSGRIIVDLSSKLSVSFSPKDAEGLERASSEQLRQIEITPSGLGLHFPELDADLYLPSLLQGFLGSRSWMASRLGAVGGSSTSVAKRAASRANGKLGGRPKRRVAG